MRLDEKVRLALGQDSTIAVTRAELETAEGKTEAYLDSLGLSRTDLKRLERKGFALRGYKPSPKGHELRWLIIERVEPTVPTGTNLDTPQKVQYERSKGRGI